jgi:hypothetical protein
MRNVRVLRRLRSRRKHEGAALTASLEVIRNGQLEVLQLPLEEFPVVLEFPTFERPGFLIGRNVTGVNIIGMTAVSFGPSPADLLRSLGAQSIRWKSIADYPIAFARMIAKIGYATAVADGKTALLSGRASVLPAIRGESDDIGHWVGTADGPIRKYRGCLHRVAVIQDRDRRILRAEVQLFADSETPTYEVVLGQLRGE